MSISTKYLNILWRLALSVSLILIVITLTACGFLSNAKIDLSSGFYDVEEYPNSYQRYELFDYNELSLQIPEFDNYRKMNENWINDCEDDITEYGFTVIPNKNYVVGRDIEPGLYFIQLTDTGDTSDYILYTRKIATSFNYLDYDDDRQHYVYLLPGDELKAPTDSIIIATAKNRPQMTDFDGLYLESVYSVPDELPPGEYFALQMNYYGSSPEIETDSGGYTMNRFGYVRIWVSDTFVQLANCILIPIDKKPTIFSVQKEDGEIYGQGMYKVGEDIPLGTYAIHPDLFLLSRNSDGTTRREDDDWMKRTIYEWMGYKYYSERIFQRYSAQLGLLDKKPIVRKIGKFTVMEYELFDENATVTLDTPGEFIELKRIGLQKINQ